MNDFLPTNVGESAAPSSNPSKETGLLQIQTSQDTPTASNIPADGEYKPVVGRTMADLVWPFLKDFNIYIVVALLLFISFASFGHLTNLNEFKFCVGSIAFMWIVVFISKWRKSR